MSVHLFGICKTSEYIRYTFTYNISILAFSQQDKFAMFISSKNELTLKK